MRVLILSSSTGAGHDSCANAIKEVFDSNGEYCEIVEGCGSYYDKRSYNHIPSFSIFIQIRL